MNTIPKILLSLFAIITPLFLFGQKPIKSTGPVIENYGAVWEVNSPDFKTDTEMTYRVIFDIYNTPESPEQVNQQINTLARFLNMHVSAGVPLDQLHVAAVFHNKASTDILSSSHYHEKHGMSNPNEPLINALMDHGVKFYFCGQSSLSRGVPKENIVEGIDLALSAMTVILDHTAKGYTLIKF